MGRDQVIVAAALGGVLAGPVLRGQIFTYSVASGRVRRRDGPSCGSVIGLGLSCKLALLPVTGRCPICRQPVGPPPLIVEAAAGGALALLAWRIDQPFVLIGLAWLLLVGIALVFVDIAVRRLPDRLTLTAAIGLSVGLAVAAVCANRPSRFLVAVGCAVGVGLFYLVLALATASGIGLGDSKMGVGLGLATGWFGWAAAVSGVLLSLLLAGLYSAVLLATRTVGRKELIPYGPFLLMGSLTAIAIFGG